MNSPRFILPSDLDPSEGAAYQSLRENRLLSRDEAVAEIKRRRSKKIVATIFSASSDRLAPRRPSVPVQKRP